LWLLDVYFGFPYLDLAFVLGIHDLDVVILEVEFQPYVGGASALRWTELVPYLSGMGHVTTTVGQVLWNVLDVKMSCTRLPHFSILYIEVVPTASPDRKLT
jgi:hypothetical protein